MVASKGMFVMKLLKLPGCWTDGLLGSTPNLLFPSCVLRADKKSPAAFSVSLLLFVPLVWGGFKVFLPASLIAFMRSWGWDWDVVAELGMLLGGGGGGGGLGAAGKDREGAGGGRVAGFIFLDGFLAWGGTTGGALVRTKGSTTAEDDGSV